MPQVFRIEGSLPSLNDHIAATNKSLFAGNAAKQATQQIIMTAIRRHGVEPIKERACFRFNWYEENKRRDPDNVLSAHKFILDALQESGVIPGDGWAHLIMPVPFMDHFYVDKVDPRVEVYIFTESEINGGSSGATKKKA